jgi:hypothetical protein
MVLDEVNFTRLAFLELECDTPRSIYVNPPAPGLISTVRVKAQPGNREVGKPLRMVQRVQNLQTTPLQILAYATALSRFKKLFQPLVIEGLKHRADSPLDGPMSRHDWAASSY